MKKDFDWNLIPCGIAFCKIETNEQGNTQYILNGCNSTFLACAGKEGLQDELYGSSFLELISLGDKERFLHFIQEILAAKGEVCAIECNMITAKGELCNVCWRGRSIEDEDRGILFSVLNFDFYKKEREMLLEAVHAGQAEANRMQRLMMSLPMGVAVFKEDKGFSIRAGNTEFFRLTGYSKVEMVEDRVDLFDCIYPTDREKLRDTIENCREKNIANEVTLRIQEREGEIHWVILQCNLYQYIAGKAYFSIICWDVTERKEMEDELRILGEQYRLLQEVADEVPMEYDVETRHYRIPVRYADSEEGQTVQYISQEKAISHMHEDDREAYCKAYEEASKTECHGSIDFRIHDSSCATEDTYIWYRTIYRSIVGADNKVTRIVGKTYNITADKERLEQMSEEIRLDPQTRVFNKVETQRLVDGFLANPTSGAHVLFVIDVDNFKRINDTFGHTVGDTIIADMSRKIQDSFRNTDVVGRIGGDEFVVFMKGTTENFARRKAEQLCKVAKKVIYGGEEKLQITISVGIAVFGKDGDNYAELFENADKAMYHVKKEAKNGYAFANGMMGMEADEERSLPNAIVTSGEKVDREILNLAFNLLSHAKDLDVSLNLLLEQLGRHFNLNMVSVFIYDDKKEQMTLTNYWSNMGMICEKEIVPRTWKLFDEEPIGVFVNIAETYKHLKWEELFSLENWDKTREPIRSMGAIKFELPNGTIGELNIGTTDANVHWGEVEEQTICEISRVVSVFVSLQTRLWEDRQTIHQLRHRERLTGLYDRESFVKKVDRIIKERKAGANYAVAVLDVNNFAYVNENFGNNIGDQILCDLADLLEHGSVYSQFACRMYSDYFAVFFKAEEKEEIIDTVINGTKAFEEILNKKYPMGSLGLSVGLCFIEDNMVCEICMENANIARKYAKEHKIVSGIVFAEYMREKRDELIEVTSHFHDAIEKEEFEVYLQPKFLLGTGKVYGAEALARWNRGEGMILKPDSFVPALEIAGYIIDLDFYIFEKLLKVMKDWMNGGKKLLTISTNFSRRHFENGGQDFLKRMQRLIDFYRVPTEYIEIEITESMVVDNMEALHYCMEELKKMGFRIAIDDFGTGYSSLNVLLEIPANVIKMDKTFTGKLGEEKQRRFVSKMGLLIKAARQEVLFEGIETEEQLQHLKESGFKYGQGFLFDKPMNVKEFEQKYL